MTIKTKPGANYNDLAPEMKHACAVATTVYANHDYVAVLTSGKDGVHKRQSLHDIGLAGDFRTRQLRDEIKATIVTEIQKELGPEYEVLLESDHIHIEYDPRKANK